MEETTLTRERARLLWAALLQSVVANGVLAAIVVDVEAAHVPARSWIAWLGAMGLHLALWIVLGVRRRRALRADPTSSEAPWLRAARVMNGVSGLIWSASGWVLFPPRHPAEQLVLGIFLAGLIVGSLSNLAIDPRSAVAFALPVLPPFLVRFHQEGGLASVSFPIAMVLFAGYLFASSARVARQFAENVRLRTEAIERERVLSENAQALREARDQADAASRAKSDFLASMSHELRTPLNAVLGYAGLLGDDPRLPGDARDQAQEIERAGQHLLALVADLIDLSRIEAGRLAIEKRPVELGPVVDACLALVTPLARRHEISLWTDHGPASRARVLADEPRLRQVLVNFLSNAIKYNRPHGRVDVACEPIPTGVRVSVKDSGLGIAAEKQAQIFHAFDRLGRERGPVEGTGIGLVITRRIVEAMGGSIGFESHENEGSCFWVELACSGASSLDSERAIAALASPVPWAPAMQRVLLAEDNPVNQRLALAMLARLGHPVDVAADGDEAVAAAARGGYALILMDCQMPGLDGFGATEAIRRREAGSGRVPIVALTADAMAGDRERCLAAGMDGYLAKPLSLARLQEAIAAHALAPREPSLAPRASGAIRTPSTSMLASEAGPARPAPAAQVMDLARIDEFTGAERPLARHVASLFLSSLPALREEISALVAAGDEAAAVRVHRLRGSLALFVSERFAGQVLELEEAARAGRAVEARAAWGELLPRLEALEHELRAFVAAEAEAAE